MMCAISALRSSAFDGMQPDVEADAAPVLLLDHRRGLAELGGPDGGDVATGSGSEDEDVEVAGFGVACGHRSSLVAARYPAPRDPLRRLRDQPGPRADGRALPPLAAAGDRLADRLEDDVRRGGPRLGRRARHDRAGPVRAGLRGRLRRHPRGRVGPRRLGVGGLGALPQDQGAGLHHDRGAGRLDLRPGRVRGWAAVGVVPRGPRQRRRGRRRRRTTTSPRSGPGPAAPSDTRPELPSRHRGGRPPRRCCRRGRGRTRRSRRRGTPARAAARAAPPRRGPARPRRTRAPWPRRAH